MSNQPNAKKVRFADLEPGDVIRVWFNNRRKRDRQAVVMAHRGDDVVVELWDYEHHCYNVGFVSKSSWRSNHYVMRHTAEQTAMLEREWDERYKLD